MLDKSILTLVYCYYLPTGVFGAHVFLYGTWRSPARTTPNRYNTNMRPGRRKTEEETKHFSGLDKTLPLLSMMRSFEGSLQRTGRKEPSVIDGPPYVSINDTLSFATGKPRYSRKKAELFIVTVYSKYFCFNKCVDAMFLLPRDQSTTLYFGTPNYSFQENGSQWKQRKH